MEDIFHKDYSGRYRLAMDLHGYWTRHIRAFQSLSKSLDLIQALNPPPTYRQNWLKTFWACSVVKDQRPGPSTLFHFVYRIWPCREHEILYISWFNDWFSAAQSPYTACTIETDLLLGWWQHQAYCGLLTIGRKVSGSSPIIEIHDMPDAIRNSYLEAFRIFLPKIAVSFRDTDEASNNKHMRLVYNIWTMLFPHRQAAFEVFRDDMHEGLCVKLFFTMDEEVKRSRTLPAIAESGRFPLVPERRSEYCAKVLDGSARTGLRDQGSDEEMGGRRGLVPEEVSLTRYNNLRVRSTVLTFVYLTHRSFPLGWIYYRPISSDLALFDRFGRPTPLGSGLASLSSHLCCSTDDFTYIWLTLHPFACICSSLE